MSQVIVSTELNGKTYSIETGKLAKFADGAVMVRCGDTMALVTVVASDEIRPGINFLPLQVEYREKTSAAGKFPGGFIKREGRPSDHEVLCSRLIDRPIRPMLPKSWRYETQILPTVFSFDPDVDPETLAMVGASAALMISDIPFEGPVSEVKVGRIDGEFIINPSFEQMESSDIDMTVAGTNTSIAMVEGESKEISEDEFLEALQFAHEYIKILNDLQNELADKIQTEKREFEEPEPPEDIASTVKETVSEGLDEYVHSETEKNERKEWRDKLKNLAMEKVEEVYGEEYEEDEEKDKEELDGIVDEIFSRLEKDAMRAKILDESKRLDGRGLTDIRDIDCEVGVLPRSHGSALFTRGETQSMGMVTLGTSRDNQMVDGLLPSYERRFYLHYNFPPYCTGEVKRLGVGRREVGHGNLAERAFQCVLPDEDNFPYTIRVTSEILQSNGSSSMATVCSGSLAMYDCGVPIKKAVAGIAMGLIKEGDRVAVLSDILGDEDFLGDMDFKVAGTKDGITAYQMDIKIDGLPIDIMKKALAQAKEGRFHILDKMNEVIDQPREKLSEHAPRFTIIQIPQDTIGALIGSGGETIRQLTMETDTDIDIQEDGKIVIASQSEEAANEAIKQIKEITKKPEEGAIYEGVVREIKEGVGAIVEFLPKKSGLLHISNIAYERIDKVTDVVNVGDEVKVKLLEATRDGKFRLSRKALLPKPEGWEDRPPRKPRGKGGPPRGGGSRRSPRR